MTRLLVSVRSAAEAQAALAGGADLIDVKEPRRGSLGAAPSAVRKEVAAAVGAAVPLSAALGELAEFAPAAAAGLQGYAYAKLGLAQCAQSLDWVARWQSAFANIATPTARVAVAYADYSAAQAPPPEEICTVGQRIGCRALLVDTFEKKHGDVFDALGTKRLAELCEQARSSRLMVVLAGSLTLARLAEAMALRPDYVAVRGAVCRQSRTGELDEGLVRQWARSLHSEMIGNCSRATH